MAKQVPGRPVDEMSLMADLWSDPIKDDPLAFVMYVFPWGKKGTPLEFFAGPKQWQVDILRGMREHILMNRRAGQIDNDGNLITLEVLRQATASGRGVGKSALVAWLILWMMSTRIGGTVIVSANSEPQLKSVTWGELSKWHSLSINKHWFEITATKLVPAEWYSDLVQRDLLIGTRYYYAEGKLWSEENPDAFAGAHSQYGMAVIFDEASGIPNVIWDVAQGYFTDPIVDRYWFAFSNPRRNEGAFFECFGVKRNFWKTLQIDARTVEGTDIKVYQAIIDEHGVDSRQAKIEVYGQFPSTGENQFIEPGRVRKAMEREVVEDYGAPLLMGVDVARFGDDMSVIAFRKGRDARTIPWLTFKGLDTVGLVAAVAHWANKMKPDGIFVDGGGVGGGVVDQLKALGYRVHEVQAGSSADDKQKYQNKRVEMWDRMREWLLTGAIPNEDRLLKDLTGLRYKYTIQTDALQLERKEEMKKRGLASPDYAEALVQTYAKPVARTDLQSRSRNNRRHTVQDLDYQILS